MLLFETEEKLIEFLDGLHYEPNNETLNGTPYFVINNSHMLPAKVLQKHNKLSIGYPIKPNTKLLRNVTIDDNCVGNGFTGYIQSIS
jgi:hypothetical protein